MEELAANYAKEKMQNQYLQSQVLNNNNNNNNGENQPLMEAPAPKCTELGYYNKYFRLTSDQLVERVKCAVMPWKKDFFTLIEGSPDLYGPWWICITIVVMLAISGNLYRYFQINSSLLFQYNFTFIPTAFMCVAIYQLFIPLVLYLLFKSFQCPLSYVETVCGIGYSLISFVIAIGVCSYPSSLLQWLALIGGCSNATLFLSNNYNHYLQRIQLQNNRYVVIAIILLSQVSFLFVVKLYFFQLVYVNANVNNTYQGNPPPRTVP